MPTARATEVLGRELEDEVDMIDLDGEFLDPEAELLRDRANGLRDPRAELRFAEPAAPFRTPDQVVLAAILRVAARSPGHAASMPRPPRRRVKGTPSPPYNPPARIRFPPAQRAGLPRMRSVGAHLIP
jgi:hypothetical protein